MVLLTPIIPFFATFARRKQHFCMLRSHGIVLRTVHYNDNQLIVDIFTELMGNVAFLVRQPRGRKGGARAGSWQPLALVEITWEHRMKSTLQKPRELTLWQPWKSLPFQPVKAAVSLFLAEFLHGTLRHEQENEPLFSYLVNALSWFDESESHYANFHIVFLLGLTRFLGFLPNTEDWHEGDYFDLQSATFTRVQPMHPHILSPLEAALVPKFLRMDLRSMQAVGLNGSMRRRALEVVTEFYRLHVPEFPVPRSIEVLAEVFSS